MNNVITFDSSIPDQLISFAVIICKYNDKWLFCKHKNRDTYETVGGRREQGESIFQTARRELFEESGAITYELDLVSRYRMNDLNTCGALFYADIQTLSTLPESEIESIHFFDEIPQNLTYPHVQQLLTARVLDHLYTSMIGKG
ncbi:NUDIX domain-containing protein [Thermoactinomyces sp. DSM 45892]|uniref:NUDIX hydrolase n=1 Tax=Thermoactinomyces sp. DSM 45892 TaxID=1882753 RepID=UPI0008982C80|nr:NUDIX domain-containing protein [Thermoactinomyces sp. DSM 45892]SDX92736.1 8-oxo-dGTPase [Thermoactinomyces sp. DSM 45892]